MYLVKEVNYSDWKENFQNCRKMNMLQCWQYGDAKVETSRWNAVRFLIMNEDSNVVALVQVLSITLPFIGGIARINRGPILISETANVQDRNALFELVIVALLQEFKKRHWWFIQIAPEIHNSELENEFLKNIGLKKLAVSPYASGLLDLQKDEKKLLMSLKKKWRYYLRKGQDLAVTVSTLVGNSAELEILLDRYRALKKEKKFTGISEPLILSLSRQLAEEWQFTLFIANQEGHVDVENCSGMLVSIQHGDTATYLIGITNNEGRELQVNYVLLWQAIIEAKKNGCMWFDIGGLDATTPKGIAHFKKGIQSEPYYLIGEWRGFVHPWKAYNNYF